MKATVARMACLAAAAAASAALLASVATRGNAATDDGFYDIGLADGDVDRDNFLPHVIKTQQRFA